MKFPNISAAPSMSISGNGSQYENEVDFYSSWQNSTADEYIDSKMLLESSMTNLSTDSMLVNSLTEDDYEIETKPTLHVFGDMLNPTNNNNNLAELKPLPPFTGYTANLNINGIQGHHTTQYPNVAKKKTTTVITVTMNIMSFLVLHVITLTIILMKCSPVKTLPMLIT